LDKRVKLIITDQLIEEIKLVTLRDKLRKYFDPERVQELISLIEIISDNIKIEKIEKICRDPKDDFLLALAKKSKADYLVTGDIDLLGIKLYNKTKIITAKTFESFFK
jgi:putative PIN family toxin of toxin-antitoxin system